MIPLASCIINNTHIVHSINLVNDATYFVAREKEVLMSVDSNGYVYKGDHAENIGKFHMNEKDGWTFKSVDGDIEISHFTPDLIETEMRVFKELVERKVLTLPTTAV